MDFNIKLSDGKVLNGYISSPGENTRAVIIMVHGLGEHIRRYSQLSEKLKDSGIGFTGVDLPGHGKSDGRRGHIKSYLVVKEMIDILIRTTAHTFPGIPLLLYGHSLGGGIVLDYILKNKPRIKGAIVTSPWLKLSFEPPKSKLVLASVMKFILPGLVQPSGLNADHISHDREVVERYKSDPLIHDKLSVSLFDSAMKAAEYSLKHASELEIPILLLHGSDDMITSPDGSRDFASKNSKTMLRIFEGGYHELHNEPIREEVFDTIISWIRNLR